MDSDYAEQFPEHIAYPELTHYLLALLLNANNHLSGYQQSCFTTIVQYAKEERFL